MCWALLWVMEVNQEQECHVFWCLWCLWCPEQLGTRSRCLALACDCLCDSLSGSQRPHKWGPEQNQPWAEWSRGTGRGLSHFPRHHPSCLSGSRTFYLLVPMDPFALPEPQFAHLQVGCSEGCDGNSSGENVVTKGSFWFFLWM